MAEKPSSPRPSNGSATDSPADSRSGDPPLSSTRDSFALARRAAFAAFATIYGAMSLLRYETFHSRSLDMAYYVRLVWGLAHGRPDNPIVGAPHLLGLHLEPMLLPFAALSRLGIPIAEVLLVAQALVAALAIFPVHALSRRHIAPVLGERAAFLCALSIYLVPTVSRCVDYDFHPTTMAIAPLAAWISAVDAGRLRRSWIWFAIGLTFREDIGLQLAAAALTFVAFPTRSSPDRPHQRRHMAAQALIGTLWFFVYALFIQPRFLPDPATSSFGAHFERFSGGGGGVAGVLGAAFAHPAALARYLISGDRLGYAPLLLATVGLVALASPRWLAGTLPVFAINLLSDFAGVRHAESHYATTMAPFLVAAALAGTGRIATFLQPFAPRLRAAGAVALVVASASFWWCRGAAPGAPDFAFAAYHADAETGIFRARVAALKGESRVVAEVRLLAHLAERPEPLIAPSQRLYWKK